MRIALALLVFASIAHADATPPKGDSSGHDWCWDWYRTTLHAARAGEVPGPRKLPRMEGWKRIVASHKHKLALRAPSELIREDAQPGALASMTTQQAREAFGSLFSLSRQAVPDPLRELQSRFQPVLVIVERSFEELVKDAEDSGDLFPGKVTSATRAITVGKQAATELCAMVARSPGHATLQDGRHIPMPMTYDLLRGYRIERKGQPPVTVAFRVEESNLASDEPIFARVLESLEVQ